MTHDEMIAIIKAHKDGKTIEIKRLGHSFDQWFIRNWSQPNFDFSTYEYRVKKEPVVVYVNPNRPNLSFTQEEFDKLGVEHKSRLAKFVEVMED